MIVIGTQPGGFDGGGGGGGGGFGGDCSTESCQGNNYPANTCTLHALVKPADCPEPIPMPAGPRYGQDKFRSGSALARAIAFIDNTTRGYDTTTQQKIAQALSDHTTDLRFVGIPLSTLNARLVEKVGIACDIQRVRLDLYPMPFTFRPTFGEYACAELVDQLAEETGEPQFLPWFITWLAKEGIDPTDSRFIPQTLVNFLSPANSLKQKFDQVEKDNICANWWDLKEGYGCVSPKP